MTLRRVAGSMYTGSPLATAAACAAMILFAATGSFGKRPGNGSFT